MTCRLETSETSLLFVCVTSATGWLASVGCRHASKAGAHGHARGNARSLPRAFWRRPPGCARPTVAVAAGSAIRASMPSRRSPRVEPAPSPRRMPRSGSGNGCAACPPGIRGPERLRSAHPRIPPRARCSCRALLRARKWPRCRWQWRRQRSGAPSPE